LFFKPSDHINYLTTSLVWHLLYRPGKRNFVEKTLTKVETDTITLDWEDQLCHP
jgi:hypothetical protein